MYEHQRLSVNYLLKVLKDTTKYRSGFLLVLESETELRVRFAAPPVEILSMPNVDLYPPTNAAFSSKSCRCWDMARLLEDI